MRPQTKNTKQFTHRQQKIPRTKTTKKKKQTTTNIIAIAINYYRIRVHYTVLTQHTTPTNNTQPNHNPNYQATTSKILLDLRGDLIEQQTVLPQTPNSMPQTKTNHQNQNTNNICPAKPLTTKKAERPQEAFVSLIPPHAQNTCRTYFHLKTKTATTRCLTSTKQ